MCNDRYNCLRSRQLLIILPNWFEKILKWQVQTTTCREAIYGSGQSAMLQSGGMVNRGSEHLRLKQPLLKVKYTSRPLTTWRTPRRNIERQRFDARLQKLDEPNVVDLLLTRLGHARERGVDLSTHKPQHSWSDQVQKHEYHTYH